MEDVKNLEEASNSSEESEEKLEEESEDTGSFDDDASSDEEVVEPSEDEEYRKLREEWAEELRKERERLGKKIDKERQKRIEAQKKALTSEEVQKLIEEKTVDLERRLMRDRVISLIEQKTSSPEEKELALFKYDHYIIPTGNIEEDVENAIALVNWKRLKSEINEVRTSVNSKESRSQDSGAGAPAKPKKQQKFSQEVIDSARFAGVSPEEFVKKLEQRQS